MPCNHTHCPPLMCIKSGQKHLLSLFFIFHRLSSSCSHFPPLLLPPPLLVFLLAQLSLDHAHIFIAFHGGDVGGSQCFDSHVLSRVFWKEWMARHDIIRSFSKQWFLFTTGTRFRDLMGLYKFTEWPMKAPYTHEYQDSGCQETRRILVLDSRRYDTSLSSSVTSLLSSKHADTYKLTSMFYSSALSLSLPLPVLVSSRCCEPMTVVLAVDCEVTLAQLHWDAAVEQSSEAETWAFTIERKRYNIRQLN